MSSSRCGSEEPPLKSSKRRTLIGKIRRTNPTPARSVKDNRANVRLTATSCCCRFNLDMFVFYSDCGYFVPVYILKAVNLRIPS